MCRPVHRWSSSQRAPWTYPKIPINRGATGAGDHGASQNPECAGRSQGDGRLTGRAASRRKAPGKVTCQRVVCQVLDPSGDRDAIYGALGEIACRCKGGNLAVYVIGNCSGYGRCARSCHRKVGGVDRCGVHRLTEGGTDALVDRHTGCSVGREGRTHGRSGRVRGRTAGKAPRKVT